MLTVDAVFWRCTAANAQELQLPKRICVKPLSSNKHRKHGYAMVGSCPLHNSDKNLESLCTARFTIDDLFGMLPVSDLQNKTTYKNIFCAMCNQASNVTYWKFSAACRRLSSHDIPTNRSLMLAFITRQPECGWNFQPPRVKSEKLCLALEQKCPDSDLVHEEPLLRELCSFYVVPACTNPHCDICKGEGIEWYACEAPRTGGEGSHYSMPPPLNILFDFSSSCHSLQVGDRKTVIKNKRCSENFVFDPVAEKCVQIYFPISNFEIIDSRNFGVSKNNSYINGSQVENKINCSHVKVNISSVTYLSNGSIWISLHKRMYNKERYFINGTSVFLCADFKRAYTVTEELASTEISPLQIITCIGCIISMISLIALLGIYIALPELRTLPGKNLISLSCAMLLYHIFFLLTGQTDKPNLCMAVSVLLHYFLLSSFCWMGVMAFDVKKTFGVKGNWLHLIQEAQ